MKLYVESELPVSAETAWELFQSEEFDQRLEEAANIRCEPLDETKEGDVTVRRLRYTSKTELPTIAAKALGSKHLTYVQTNRFDPGAGQLEWTVDLPVVGDRVDVAGVTTITDTDTGSRRVVDGEIEVRIRFVGGQIEKAVCGQFEKSMERAVDIVRDLAREKGLT